MLMFDKILKVLYDLMLFVSIVFVILCLLFVIYLISMAIFYIQ